MAFLSKLLETPGIRGMTPRQFARLPRYINGTMPDIHSLGVVFKNAFAAEMLRQIHIAFDEKSGGGTDETGLKWKPLKRETIAQRPIQPGEWKKHGILGLGRGGRGLLTAAQNKLWKGIFYSTWKRLALKIGDEAAKREAAKLAWAILKSQGAKTRLETLGDRKVPILVVSGRLSDSLEPGSVEGTAYLPPPEQLFERHWGSVTMGTKVPYAAKQHKTRPLWPSGAAMMRAGWFGRAAKKAIKAVVGHAAG